MAKVSSWTINRKEMMKEGILEHQEEMKQQK